MESMGLVESVKMGQWGRLDKTELKARGSSGLQTLSHLPQKQADGRNDNDE